MIKKSYVGKVIVAFGASAVLVLLTACASTNGTSATTTTNATEANNDFRNTSYSEQPRIVFPDIQGVTPSYWIPPN